MAPETGQRPPRTRAVAALDLTLDALDALAALRRRVLAPVRLAAEPGAGRLLTRGAVVAAVTVVLVTGLVVAALLRTPDGFAPMGIGPDPDPTVTGSIGPARAGIGPNSSAASSAPRPSAPGAAGSDASSPGTGPAAPDAPVPLAAEYTTERRTLVGYHAALAITNPGAAPVRGWTAVLVLPRRSLTIADVQGAIVTQEGTAWTFVPDRDSREVPAGGTVRVTFRVNGAALGATEPTGCTVDGRPCVGEFPASP